MIIWILFAIMTTAITAVLLHPLASTRRGFSTRSVQISDVYRDQLKELDRDRRSGHIDQDQYEYARAETARRLFHSVEASPTERGVAPSSFRLLRATVVIAIPIFSICIYVFLGTPDLPSQPLAARLENPGRDTAILIVKAERHLVANPDDGKGWDVLAPIYLNAMRVEDAERAYRNAIRLLGPSSTRLDGLAGALMAAADGTVTKDALEALKGSLAIEPNNPRARFYVALSMEQVGKTDAARAAFQAIAADSPAEAPWLPLVKAHIASNGGAPLALAAKPEPDPSIGEISPLQAMPGADQLQLVRSMVEGLDAKLAEHPDDLEGWVRLVRSYAVLNDLDRAATAVKRALAVFPSSGEQGRRMLELAGDLGISTEGMTK